MRPGLSVIKSNGRYFDYFYEDRGSPVTFVTFHAATGPSTVEYPIFSGRRIADKLGINLLAFADVACGGAEKLLTFWHQSTKRVPSSKFITRIINKAQQEQDGRHLIFFGSSAGGFAALNYSARFRDSVALVLNPRIELGAKPYRFKEYAQIAFPGWSLESVASRIPMSMSKLYSEGQANTVAFIQNSEDLVYFNNHFTPFHDATKLDQKVLVKLGNWGKGHVIPPEKVYMEPLELLVTNAPNWARALNDFQ